MNAGPAAFFEQVAYKLRLQEGLSAGDRYPAARCLVKDFIPAYSIERFIGVHWFAVENERLVRAY
jgi:hypothetical protein